MAKDIIYPQGYWEALSEMKAPTDNLYRLETTVGDYDNAYSEFTFEVCTGDNKPAMLALFAIVARSGYTAPELLAYEVADKRVHKPMGLKAWLVLYELEDLGPNLAPRYIGAIASTNPNQKLL
jgi:hypothetical protein